MEQGMYRWVILIISFIIMAVPFSLVNTIHTLFVQPVATSLNISLTAFSLLFSISAVVNAVMSPLVGWLLNKIPIKLIMSISAALVGGGFAAYSNAHSIYMFYIIAVIVSIGMAGLTTIPVSTMLTNWFGKKRGFAIGIAFAGMGMGTFFWMNLAAQLILTNGYSQAYQTLGCIILFVAMPISLLAKLKPEKLSITNEKAIKKNESYAVLLADKQLRIFGLGLAGLGLVAAGIQMHVQPYLAISGFSLEHNAQIGSIIAIASLTWNIVIGSSFDRFPTITVLKIIAVFSSLTILMLFLFQYQIFHYIFAILVGSLLSMSALWPTYGVGRMFNHYNYAAVLGLLNLFFIIGASLGPTLSGIIADSEWGYKGAWTLYFLCFIMYMYIFMKPFWQMDKR